MPLLLTRDQAAEVLHVSADTVRRLSRQGELDEVRVSTRLVRVTAASVERLARDGIGAGRLTSMPNEWRNAGSGARGA